MKKKGSSLLLTLSAQISQIMAAKHKKYKISYRPTQTNTDKKIMLEDNAGLKKNAGILG